MLMGKQMILAVLVVSIAFGTVTEYQILPVFLCSAADRALMDAGPLLPLPHTPAVDLSPVYLLRGIPPHIFHAEEENQKVAKGYQRHDRKGRMRYNSRLNQRQV